MQASRKRPYVLLLNAGHRRAEDGLGTSAGLEMPWASEAINKVGERCRVCRRLKAAATTTEPGLVQFSRSDAAGRIPQPTRAESRTTGHHVKQLRDLGSSISARSETDLVSFCLVVADSGAWTEAACLPADIWLEQSPAGC